MAEIYNDTSYTLISGTNGNDYVMNGGAYSSLNGVTIDTGAGDDTICNNNSDYSKIYAGEGDDSIKCLAWGALNVTIDGGAGNDFIKNMIPKVLIYGGSGNDIIENSDAADNENVTINGGEGDDYIFNDSQEILFQYATGDGNDLIEGFNETATLQIDGGTGTYSKETVGSDLIVHVGDGSITLVGASSLANVNIAGVCEGLNANIPPDALIYNGHSYYVFANVADTWEEAKTYCESLGGHLAVINNADENSAVYSYAMQSGYSEIFFGLSDAQSEGTWTWVNGEPVTYTNWEKVIDVEPNGGTWENYVSFKSMYTNGEWNDAWFGNGAFICEWDTEPTSGSNSKLITLTEGNDTCNNTVEGATINALGGDDIINNSGSNVSINGSVGNDSIFNDNGSQITIAGGTGNDYIHSGGYFHDSWHEGGSNNSIDGGAGNDYIINDHYSSRITVNGGAGNDSIHSGGSTSQATLLGGDGNDFISNDGTNNLINCGAGNDSIRNTGSHVLIQYSSGDGSDLIQGFNDTSTLSIDGGTGTYSKETVGSDLIVHVGDGSITLVGAASLANVNIKGKEIIVDLIWSINGTTATYGTSTNTLITVKGVKSLDGISLNGSTVTVTNSSLNQFKVTISDGYTLALGSDVTKTTAKAAHFDGTTYKSASNTAGYALSDNQITYVAAQTETDLFTISGVANTSGVTIDGTTVKVAASSLNQSTVTITNGYTLKLADDVTKTTTTAAHWDHSGTTATYKNTATSEGYSLINNQIVYSKASGGETLITVNGVKSKDGISLSGTTVTVANASLNQAAVSISDGYTLALGTDVTKTATTAAHWDHSGTTATYKNAKTTAGYKLDNNQIHYVGASGGDTLITVNGVKSKDGISLKGSTVTVGNSALNQTAVTINSGYTLALASDVKKTKTTAAGWSRSGNVATYKNASTTAGYSLSNNQISYNTASGGETLVTVTGIKSLDGISLSGKIVTVSASALNKETVTVSNGYTLAVDHDVPLSTTTAADWTFSNSTATYTNSSTSAGYSLIDNQIVYNEAGGGETLVEVKGVKSSKGLTLDGKTVTVGADALNQKTVTVSSGYTLALENDVTTPTTTAAAWSLKDSTATYKNKYTSAGYKLSNNQIEYKAASGGETLITVDGVKSLDGISLNGTTVKVAASALNKANVTLTGDNYKLALENDVTNPKTANAWSYKSSKATYDQTTTAGYTLASNGKSIIYSEKATTGLITVNGVKSADGISLSKKVVTVGAAALDKKAVTVTDGYTLKLGSDVTKQTTKKAAWGKISNSTTTYKGSYKTAGYKLSNNKISYEKATTASTLATVKGAKKNSFTVKGNNITLKNAALKKQVTVSGGYNFNFASDYKTATITGSSKGDTITTNGSKLLVNGGKGNDTLKIFGTTTTVTGGDGADVFIFKTGSNVIADYAAADKISVAGTAKVTTSGSNLVFTVGSGKLTVTGGKDKKVTYIDKSGENVYAYSAGYKTSGAAVTLLKNYLQDSFNVASYGDDLQTVDGSAVQLDIKITGNDLRNSIKGGENNETLIGGRGNDTLTGGDGSDVFIYAKGDGNDLITDYAEEDRIKITSGTAKVKKNGNNVIFTVGSNKITVKGAASKTVTYIDANGKLKYFPRKPASPIILTDKNTTAILRETYSDSTYTATSAIKTIDASAVQRNLSITGNGKANVILGGSEDDTIYGGKGNDTLQGGSGADVFTYANGDGKDIIIDYAEEDTIQITKGTAKVKKSGSDVVFTVGSGKITVLGAANKTISYIEGNKKKTYGSSTANVLEDDNFITGNDLNSLVQSKAADYSLAEVQTSLKSANALDKLTFSGKK